MQTTGEQVVQALAMMGHQVTVSGRKRDQSRHVSTVVVRYVPLDRSHCHEAAVDVTDEVLAHGGDEALVGAIQQAMIAVVPYWALAGAMRVLEALEHGPLPCEFIGGHRDGEILTGVTVDSDGWPVLRIYVPLMGCNPLPWTVLDVLPTKALFDIGSYERDWVNPDTLRWRYLATKGT